MDKIKKIFLAFLCTMSMGIGMNLNTISANALTLHVDIPYGINADVSNKWTIGITQMNSAGVYYDVFSRLSINGEIVFCVEPLNEAINGAGDYSAQTLASYTGNAALTQRLGYISSLGYGFQGDTSDEMMFATQILIWQAIHPNIVNTATIHPEIQSKINLINNRLNVMNSDVSFARQTVTLQGYGKEFAKTLTDTAGVFQYYVDNDVTGVHTERNGNNLTVWMEKGDALNKTLYYDAYYLKDDAEPASIVYTSSTSQNVARIRKTDPTATAIRVVMELGSVQINKEDFETNGKAQGAASFENAKFNLIDNKTNTVVGVLTTNVNGTSNTITDLATDRTYTIEEVVAPKGYTLSADKATVNFDTLQVVDNFKTYTGTMKDKIITGNFEIHKVITDGTHSEIVETEKGAEFIAVLQKYVEQYGSVEEAYAHRNEFSEKEYDTLVTDEDGYAKSKDLAYGTYVVKQTKGQIDTDKYEATWAFEVNQENQSTKKYIINNRPFTSYLKVVKLDKDSGKSITLSGMTFKLLNTDTNEYVSQKVGEEKKTEWTTNKKGYIVLDNQLNAGNYRLEEIKTPEGYLLSDAIDFTITNAIVSESDADGDPIKIIEVYDEQPKGKISLTKTDKETGNALENVEYVLSAKEDIIDKADGEVIYDKGSIVHNGVTNAQGKIEINDLYMGHYELRETLTNEGYVLSQEVNDIVLEKQDDTTKEYVFNVDVTNIAPKAEIHLTKTDEDSREELSGVIFQLTAKENIYSLDGRHTLLYEENDSVSVDISEDGHYMTDETGQIHITNLPLGKYTLKEVQTLEGYYENEEVYEIDLSYDGSDTTLYVEDLEITNRKTETQISKVDITNEEELEGASLSLYDENDDLIEQWTSTNEPYIIRGLSLNTEYRLHEDLAPLGYATTSDITFSVDASGEVTQVVMKDEITKTEIEKVDEETNELLVGAKLQLIDKESNEVLEEWTSTKQAHLIEGLHVDKTYIVRELEAPAHYEKAEDVEFTVADTGDVQTVVMKDARTPIVPVTTGDSTNVIPFVAIMAGAGIATLILIRKLKK